MVKLVLGAGTKDLALSQAQDEYAIKIEHSQSDLLFGRPRPQHFNNGRAPFHYNGPGAVHHSGRLGLFGPNLLSHNLSMVAKVLTWLVLLFLLSLGTSTFVLAAERIAHSGLVCEPCASAAALAADPIPDEAVPPVGVDCPPDMAQAPFSVDTVPLIIAAHRHWDGLTSEAPWSMRQKVRTRPPRLSA